VAFTGAGNVHAGINLETTMSIDYTSHVDFAHVEATSRIKRALIAIRDALAFIAAIASMYVLLVLVFCF